MPSSPFKFADTASARQQTTDLAMELRQERVAIVGVGGTGSFVLDFVAKTWAERIHLFDGDAFLQHNAFRAPGACGRDELADAPNKAVFHSRRYSRMHSGVVAHPFRIDEDNASLLADYDTVFLCIDGGAVKRKVLETCMPLGVVVIDCGMGVKRARETRQLVGTMRVTTCLPTSHDHAEECIDLSDVEDAEDEYERNAQMAELNALNAALAVIKWKKIRGVYCDFGHELHSLYALDGNRLINCYKAEP